MTRRLAFGYDASMAATLSPPAAATPKAATPKVATAGRLAATARRFDNGAQWLDALGGVPLDRVIFNPWPGMATEEDLLYYVEVAGRLCELVDGTLVEKPMGWEESRIGMKVGSRMEVHADQHGLGPVTGSDGTIRMASVGRIRLPDVSFFSWDRLPGRRLPREKVPALAPDLAVEVLSESNTPQEMAQKLREYFANGTRLAWLVDPRTRTVAVHTGPGEPAAVLGEADALDGGDVLPGFTMPVAKLFDDLPAGG